MRSVKAGRIVHAYLFQGGRGCGKRTLARRMAQVLLCQAPQQQRPCGECPACKRFLAGTHPDVRTLAPTGRSIGVDEVRELIEYLSRCAYEGGWHVAIIEQADKMTASAQNALLKTLESPPENTVFFLLSQAPGAILPTIRSRARVVRVQPLSVERCAQALVERGVAPQRAARLAGLAHGAVGRALEIAADEGYEALFAHVYDSLCALRGAGDIAAAASALYEEKERQADILEILETIGRDRMAVEWGTEPEALTREQALRVRTAGEAIVRGACQARQMLFANVAWQNALDCLYLRLCGSLIDTGGT